MKSSETLSLYIAITPKRWCTQRVHKTLLAMNRLSQLDHKGFAVGGVHPGTGVRRNFVLNLQFASQEEKQEYQNTDIFPVLLSKLKKYAKGDNFKVLS